MRLTRILAPLALFPLLTAGMCGQKPSFHTYPPPEDVRVETKPAPGPEAFESEEGYELFVSSLEAWGERGWSMVGRACRDAVRKGAPYPDGWCPEATDPDE